MYGSFNSLMGISGTRYFEWTRKNIHHKYYGVISASNDMNIGEHHHAVLPGSQMSLAHSSLVSLPFTPHPTPPNPHQEQPLPGILFIISSPFLETPSISGTSTAIVSWMCRDIQGRDRITIRNQRCKVTASDMFLNTAFLKFNLSLK